MKSIILVTIIITLGLMSCDKYSNYQMVISNNTHDTVKVYFTGQTAYTNGTDSIIAVPLNQTVYYDAEGRKIKTENHVCDPQISIDEVIIKTSSHRTLIKDISKKENWNCETDSKNTYWKMIFTIEEMDLNK